MDIIVRRSKQQQKIKKVRELLHQLLDHKGPIREETTRVIKDMKHQETHIQRHVQDYDDMPEHVRVKLQALDELLRRL
jgi:chemotaxis methyl-accepting protein methylase